MRIFFSNLFQKKIHLYVLLFTILWHSFSNWTTLINFSLQHFIFSFHIVHTVKEILTDLFNMYPEGCNSQERRNYSIPASYSTQDCLFSTISSHWFKDSKILEHSFLLRAALFFKWMKFSSNTRWIERMCSHSFIKACIKKGFFFQTDTVLSNQKYFDSVPLLWRDTQWSTEYFKNSPQSSQYDQK